jgi:NAD(P)H-flavin reductase
MSMSLVAAEERATVEGTPMRVAKVRKVVAETPDTSTYWLSFVDPRDRARYRFEPGQFNMVYVFGAGEVPISISSDPGSPLRLGHTVRATGRVTNLFPMLRPGDEVALRGPFGRPWPVGEARGSDLLIVAGGLGLAPLRPVIYDAFRHRRSFRRVMVLVGARSPEHLLYRDQLDAWSQWMKSRGVEVLLTVDTPDDAWPYGVGVASTLFEKARLDVHRTTAFVCGPEIMMKFSALDLVALGLPESRLFVSMERNMQCGVRQCGHCQFGPAFVCSDGPVFRWDEIEGLLEVAEL